MENARWAPPISLNNMSRQVERNDQACSPPMSMAKRPVALVGVGQNDHCHQLVPLKGAMSHRFGAEAVVDFGGVNRLRGVLSRVDINSPQTAPQIGPGRPQLETSVTALHCLKLLLASARKRRKEAPPHKSRQETFVGLRKREGSAAKRSRQCQLMVRRIFARNLRESPANMEAGQKGPQTEDEGWNPC